MHPRPKRSEERRAYRGHESDNVRWPVVVVVGHHLRHTQSRECTMQMEDVGIWAVGVVTKLPVQEATFRTLTLATFLGRGWDKVEGMERRSVQNVVCELGEGVGREIGIRAEGLGHLRQTTDTQK